MADPIIKWAGGKGRMLEHIVPLVPDDVPIIEPFAGGAALSLHLERPGSILVDACAPLINVYWTLGEYGGFEYLLAQLKSYEELHSKDYYYLVREEFNLRLSYALPGVHYAHAAQFMYLNKAGFNGLWRVNKSGLYNVPWGQRKKVTWDYGNLERVHELLRGKGTKSQVIDARAGAMPWALQNLPQDRSAHFWYFDPPYFNTFSSHTAKGFTEDDHRDLAERLEDLSNENAPWLLSHCDDPLYRKLYSEDRFEIIEAKVQRSIAAKSKARGKAAELLIRPKGQS